jgi:chromosome partitioning protein
MLEYVVFIRAIPGGAARLGMRYYRGKSSEDAMAIIAVFNQKGGVGKTTTCLNVVAALKRTNRRPIGLDMDPQGHLSIASGLSGNLSGDQSLAAFFNQKKELAALLRDTPNGWQLIPSSLELAKIDALHGGNPNVSTLLKRGVEAGLAGLKVPILIDCCPMLGVLTLNALLAADRVLIPVAADYLSLHGVQRLDSALNVLEKRLKRRFERRVVITRFDGRRKLSYDIYDQLKSRYGDLICNTRIRENVALATSPMHGQDVFTFAPNTPGSADYMALTQELLQSGFFEESASN